MKPIHRHPQSPSGQAVLTTVIFLLLASVALLTSFSSIALRETSTSRTDIRAKQSYFLSEAGLEDLSYRIRTGKQYAASQSVMLDNMTTTVTVITAVNKKIVESTGDVAAAIRKTRTILIPGANASFVYGVHAGDGGMEMENNSRVIGSVFSNGHIIGDGGATITGDAFAAATSSIEEMIINGNAQANSIDDSRVVGFASSTTELDEVIVGRDAHANELDDTTVTGSAYYQIIDSTSNVGGVKYPGNPGPPNLATQPLPISDADITQWKQDAQTLGTIAPGACSQNWSPPSNPYTTNGGVVEKNLILNNNQLLILKGTVWVKCTVTVENGARIQLDSSYGGSSGMMLADGWMHFKNNGILRGSGTAGSYLMLLSLASGGGHHGSAIDLHNNSTGAIFYAAKGMIFLHNNVAVTELVGHKIHLENNATLTYEVGLASVTFSSGPTGGWSIQTWNEIR